MLTLFWYVAAAAGTLLVLVAIAMTVEERVRIYRGKPSPVVLDKILSGAVITTVWLGIAAFGMFYYVATNDGQPGECIGRYVDYDCEEP